MAAGFATNRLINLLSVWVGAGEMLVDAPEHWAVFCRDGSVSFQVGSAFGIRRLSGADAHFLQHISGQFR